MKTLEELQAMGNGQKDELDAAMRLIERQKEDMEATIAQAKKLAEEYSATLTQIKERAEATLAKIKHDQENVEAVRLAKEKQEQEEAAQGESINISETLKKLEIEWGKNIEDLEGERKNTVAIIQDMRGVNEDGAWNGTISTEQEKVKKLSADIAKLQEDQKLAKDILVQAKIDRETGSAAAGSIDEMTQRQAGLAFLKVLRKRHAEVERMKVIAAARAAGEAAPQLVAPGTLF
jgi:hypothetical protein